MPRSRVHDGVVFRRKESRVWWIRYRDRNGIRRRESTLTEDWHEAQKRLRDRLQARDNNVLDVVKKGESLSFGQWADFFLETYSKPPMRAEKTHEINLRAVKHLKSAFASSSLVDLTADHDRNLLARSSPPASPNQVFPWIQRERSSATCDSTPGVSRPPAHAERCREEKAAPR